MERSSVLELLACCALSESLLREFKASPDALADEVVGLWHGVLFSYYETWETMPTARYMAATLKQRLAELSYDKQITQARDIQTTLDLMVQLAKNAPEDVERVGRKLLRQFMTGLLAAEAARKLVANPKNTRQILESSAKTISVIDGVESGRFTELFPDDSLSPDKLIYEPTGVDYVDTFLGGGVVAGEVIGHLAPSGQGKTTLVLQVGWSRVERLLAPYAGRPLESIPWEQIPRVYIFAYEIVVNLVMNLMSNAADIPRATAKMFYINKDQSLLSSSKRRDYKDYEEAMYAGTLDKAIKGQCAWPPAELERFSRVAKITNRLLQVAEFSGANPALMEWATQGVMGIRNYLQTHQDSVGSPGVSFVFADYVGAMVDARITGGAGGVRMEHRNQLIKAAPSELSREVANRFACPVWAAHQLNSEENRKGGGTIPDPRKGDGAGLFHEQCAIALASGMLSNEGVAIYILAKHRREQPVTTQIARLDRQFARWVNARKDYEIVQGRVVKSSEVNKNPQGRVSGRLIPVSGFASEDVN